MKNNKISKFFVNIYNKISDYFLDIYGDICDWYYFKFQYATDQKIDTMVKNIINYQLKPFGVDFDYVLLNPIIEDEEWFRYYQFKDEKVFKKWKKYSLKQIKRVYPYASEETISKKFAYIDLMYGLKRPIEFDDLIV